MTTLKNLNTPSLSDMSRDEAIELMRQIRLSRRTPTRPVKSYKKKKEKAPDVSADQAAELLKILTGGSND